MGSAGGRPPRAQAPSPPGLSDARQLVSTMQVLLQARRLKVAPALAEAELLAREMANFRAKATTAPEQAEPWREGAHDDLVLAVAVAAWQGERCGGGGFRPYAVGSGLGWGWGW